MIFKLEWVEIDVAWKAEPTLSFEERIIFCSSKLFSNVELIYTFAEEKLLD